MPLRPFLLLATLMLSPAWAADGVDQAPATPPAATPAAAAAKVAFGIITIASDQHSLTIADGKGGTIALKLTGQTAITRDQAKTTLAALKLDEQVRITYQDDTALSIDQLSAGKKKKKKKPV